MTCIPIRFAGCGTALFLIWVFARQWFYEIELDNGQADMIHELSLSCYATEIVKG